MLNTAATYYCGDDVRMIPSFCIHRLREPLPCNMKPEHSWYSGHKHISSARKTLHTFLIEVGLLHLRAMLWFTRVVSPTRHFLRAQVACCVCFVVVLTRKHDQADKDERLVDRNIQIVRLCLVQC